jgi:hypothetical protein
MWSVTALHITYIYSLTFFLGTLKQCPQIMPTPKARANVLSLRDQIVSLNVGLPLTISPISINSKTNAAVINITKLIAFL